MQAQSEGEHLTYYYYVTELSMWAGAETRYSCWKSVMLRHRYRDDIVERSIRIGKSLEAGDLGLARKTVVFMGSGLRFIIMDW